MDAKSCIEAATAGSTFLLALATVGLAALTYRLERAWFNTSKEQIGVNMWLELKRQFDSKEMKHARKTLAPLLKNYSTSKHGKVPETLFDLLEDIGITYRENYLNRKLADSTFSYYVCRWYELAKAYIDEERKRHGEDETLFEDFEYVAEQMRVPDEVIDEAEIQRFFMGERNLD